MDFYGPANCGGHEGKTDTYFLQIGEYDSDEGEMWDDDGDDEDDSELEGSYTSDGSWETESEKSVHEDG